METEPTANSSIETLAYDDPWAIQYQDNQFSIRDDIALILFVALGATTLLTCFFATCRQVKKRTSYIPSSCSQWASCLCVVLFFGCLSAGFFTLGTFAGEDEWMAKYSRHGQVRVLDTRVVETLVNVSLQEMDASLSNASSITFSNVTAVEYVMEAQARVTFGGEWACGRDMNDTICDTFVLMSECSTSACGNVPVGNCSDEERMQVQVDVMACIVNMMTGNDDFSGMFPIDTTTFDPTIPPQLHDDYPNFPLVEGYWNCDACSFVVASEYEMHEPDDSLKTAGIGLLCGAALVLAIWVLVQIVKWICCPQVPGSFDLVDDSSNDWQHDDNWAAYAKRAKRKPFNARRWIHSRQWTAEGPVPTAYDIGNEIEEYYGSRDGLEKTDAGVNGHARTTKNLQVGEDEEEDDEIPDYWRHWNEARNAAPPLP